MMEATEHALLDAGISPTQIDSERFDLGAASVIGPNHLRIRRSVVAIGAPLIALAAVVAR